MLLVSFSSALNLAPLVIDHLNNTGFCHTYDHAENGVRTLAFESAAYDPEDEDEMQEANDHEEGVVLEDGEYAFIRNDLQAMALEESPDNILTFSFTPHTGEDEDEDD